MESQWNELEPEKLLQTLIDRRYRLTRVLGRGSYGMVFEAAEESLGSYISRVAIKIMLPRDEQARGAVQREVRGIAQLNHDHIIVYRTSGEIDVGPLTGAVFVVTELADTSLQSELHTPQRINGEETRRMAIGIARALAHCHRWGAIHRDVKPANIFRIQDRWKLADFGLVHSQSEKLHHQAAHEGTYAYMAPEVLSGEVSSKIDVYALGVTILECLTGELAHRGATTEEFLHHLSNEPATIPDTLDPTWNALLAACLERQPQNRLSSDQLVERLGGSMEDHLGALPVRPLTTDTLIVSSLGRGQCLTIGEALQVAPAHARILVRPGRYRENIVLNRPVELIGDGPVQDVVLESSGIPLLANVEQATIRGLTIRGLCQNGDPQRYAVEVVTGKLTLIGCEITCDSLACIAVSAKGAEAILRNCRIHHGADVGLWVSGGGQAQVEDCVVVGNAKAGISVGEGSRVSVRSSKLQRGGASGLYVYKDGLAACTACDFISNNKAGIAVADGGAIDVCECRIVENSAYGVWMEAGGRGTIANCRFEKNRGSGWEIPSSCQVELLNNTTG